MTRKLAVLLGALAVVCLAAPAVWTATHDDHDGHKMVTPNDLEWTEVDSLPPGAQVAVIEGPLDEAVPFTFRIRMPADYEIPAHWHPAIEHVTVLSGTFHMGLGDKLDRAKSTELPVGSVAIMQPRTHHFAWASEDTVVQVHGIGPWAINYINPEDDPRNR